MQNENTPTEGQNSTKLEAESALRDAACSPSSFDVERVTVKREVIPVKATSLDEAFLKAKNEGEVLTESETVEYVIKDYPKDHGVPASGVGIHSERVFRAGLAGDCVVCDFGHDVCGGDFILENVQAHAPAAPNSESNLSADSGLHGAACSLSELLADGRAYAGGEPKVTVAGMWTVTTRQAYLTETGRPMDLDGLKQIGVRLELTENDKRFHQILQDAGMCP